MNNQTLPGKWYANLDTLGDKITITDPPTDTLRWYIRAVDDKGKASQIATRDHHDPRCDTEAQFERVLHGVQNRAPGRRPCRFATYVGTTRTSPTAALKVMFHWRITTPVGVPAKKPISGTGPGHGQRVDVCYQGTSGDRSMRNGFSVGPLHGLRRDQGPLRGTRRRAQVHARRSAASDMTMLRSLLPKIAVFAVSVAPRRRRRERRRGRHARTARPPRRRAPPPSTCSRARTRPAAARSRSSRSTRSRTRAGRPSRWRRSRPWTSTRPPPRSSAATRGQGTEPAVFVDPTGFPRIDPITQFDGGPFQGSNCTLASGSMLARLAFGVVTNGSTLRTLQDDQDGGTGLNDLAPGAVARVRRLRADRPAPPAAAQGPARVRATARSIQGIYGEIPTRPAAPAQLHRRPRDLPRRLLPGQRQARHPGGLLRHRPARPAEGGLQGRVVAGVHRGRVRASRSAAGAIPAMWAFPPGGVPPEVVGPDVVADPATIRRRRPSAQTPDPSAPRPRRTRRPRPSASASRPGPPARSARLRARRPRRPSCRPRRPARRSTPAWAGSSSCPSSTSASSRPSLPGCPTGLEAVFPAADPPVLQLPVGPKVDVVFVDSDRANQVIVGFTVDPPAAADVKFWVQGDEPGGRRPRERDDVDRPVRHARCILARLDVKAATTYASRPSPGAGCSRARARSARSRPAAASRRSTWRSPRRLARVQGGTGLSPYGHLAAEAFLRPMIKLDALGGCDLRGVGGLRRDRRTASTRWTSAPPSARAPWRRSPTSWPGSTPRASPSGPSRPRPA